MSHVRRFEFIRRSLPLFTPTELERMVCGKRDIDIDYLRANTRYRHPVQATDPHVQMMWNVLEGFNAEQRQVWLLRGFNTGS